ncbi:ribose ABC transport system [Klebsiella pneumoniae]|uniref:Ribose ABC transport system n=1 Tax=Klebsiella pneumoniae TaxID=573 RepID=A0A378F952_KLEPN|nr:ribose ABC transport system [Klebsiella pneumoniae]
MGHVADRGAAGGGLWPRLGQVLDPFNIINILRSIAIVTVIAIGVSISLTIGGFDLSVGSTASLANALVISLFVWHGLGTTEAILITLALCTLVGLFNAFLIVGAAHS